MKGAKQIFISAGEVSGDSIGGKLMKSLKTFQPDLRFHGIGGEHMQSQGLDSLFPVSDISVMGFSEVIAKSLFIKDRIDQTARAILDQRPDAVVTIDSKGFNFRVIQRVKDTLKANPIPSYHPKFFHYVAPSVWAFPRPPNFYKNLGSMIDCLFCLFPFEQKIFERNGMKTVCVGHPVIEDLLDSKKSADHFWTVSKQTLRSQLGIPHGSTAICVLPGSRMQEVTKSLPLFQKSLELFLDKMKRHSHVLGWTNADLCVVVVTTGHCAEHVKEQVRKWPFAHVVVSDRHDLRYNAFAASDLGLAVSGTVSLELCASNLPSVITYKSGLLNEAYARAFSEVKYASIPNLIRGHEVFPELLFRECTPQNIAQELGTLLENLELEPGFREFKKRQMESILFQLLNGTATLSPSSFRTATADKLFHQPHEEQKMATQANGGKAHGNEGLFGVSPMEFLDESKRPSVLAAKTIFESLLKS